MARTSASLVGLPARVTQALITVRSKPLLTMPLPSSSLVLCHIRQESTKKCPVDRIGPTYPFFFPVVPPAPPVAVCTAVQSMATFSHLGRLESPPFDLFLYASHGKIIDISMYTKQTSIFQLHRLYFFNMVSTTNMPACPFRNVRKVSESGESVQEECTLLFPMLAMLFEDDVGRINSSEGVT